MRAMFSNEMPLGHSTSHAPGVCTVTKTFQIHLMYHVQHALFRLAGCPCGSNENWLIFADANNIAEEFLHVATQAPQPIQVAASNALSAFSFGTGMAFSINCISGSIHTNVSTCALNTVKS